MAGQQLQVSDRRFPVARCDVRLPDGEATALGGELDAVAEYGLSVLDRSCSF